MQIIKRDGRKENVRFDKIEKRIKTHCKDLKNVDSALVSQKVIFGLYDGVTSAQLDNLAVEIAYNLSVKHPDYDVLATRLAISTLHKDTPKTFSEAMEILFKNKDTHGRDQGIIAPNIYKIIKKNAHVLDAAIDHQRDYLFDFFGFKTLERSYLLKQNIFEENKLSIRKIVERPQYMWMRVALGIHDFDIESVLSTYELLSTKQATHATPTLFNSGTVKNQLASCNLIAMQDDSIDGIYNTLKQCALISQSAGGIGVHIHNIRSKGSPIYGTGGISNGIVPMLRNFDTTMLYVDQGGNKRKGSAAIYIEPWHADIFDFLDLRKNNGKEEARARALNLALWCPDLFFQRVKEDGVWTLMDPNKCKGLSDVYGKDFETLYLKYEKENKGERQIQAKELWGAMLASQIETGQPYLLAKDAANIKSNQKNIGTICSANLCAEIIQYSDKDEIAICNLASISLPSCIEGKKKKRTFNFEKLIQITKTLTENLNKTIDIGYYPVKEGKVSNLRHRPIGIGIQGLADVFALLRYNWDSVEAKELNKKIAEAIYWSFLNTSADLAIKEGPYETFNNSPISKGEFQFDLWNVEPSIDYDWNFLREKIKKTGIRNSLGVTCMPTASTSQILGNTECIEPITSNLYKRQTLSGEFIIINKYLVEDLIELDLWTEGIRQKIISENGSIQNIEEIPNDIKLLYRTVWELSQKILIDLSADRGPFVCQSQSLNLYFKDPNFGKLSSAYMYGWEKGLKTLVYYTRTTAAQDAIKITVDPELLSKNIEIEMENLACSLDNPENCLACSS